MSPIKEANKLLHLWQIFGPNKNRVDVELLVREVVNKKSSPDYLSIAEQVLPDIDGAMVRSSIDPNSYTAMVNCKIQNPGRRRFTLAHEVGHFLLHRRIQKEFSCSRNMLEDFKTDGLELEANQFASQLLLPPNRIRNFESEPWNIETLRKISETFEVSLQAAGLRMAQISKRPIGFIVSTSDFVEWGISSHSLYKRGCFFRSMDEVPSCSGAFGCDFSHEKLDTEIVQENAWRITGKFNETSTLGYQAKIYTCIDAA